MMTAISARRRAHKTSVPFSHGARVRAAQVTLWLCLLLALATGPAAMHIASAVSAQVRAIDVPAPTQQVEAFAELFLTTFLEQAGEGQESTLRPYVDEPVSLPGVTPGTAVVTRAVVVSVDAISSSIWTVTVAADVLVHRPDGYARLGVRYYTLTVARLEDRLTALGLPAEVGAARVADTAHGLVHAQPGLGAAPRDPAVTAATRFLEAYLAGKGEVDRYTAPGRIVSAIRPAPYRSLELVRGGIAPEGDRRLVRVEVRAIDHDGLARVLHYTLRLARREGRWEVLDPFAVPSAALDAAVRSTRR